MSNKQHERTLAADYLRANPHANNVEVARELGISKRTVAYARAALRHEGELPPGRRAAREKADGPPSLMPPQGIPESEDVPLVAPSLPLPPPVPPSALPLLPDDGDVDDNEDEEVIRRRIVAVARGFALNPSLHEETRLAAAQVYIKLKDALKSKTLGPGQPLTEEQALSRLSSLLRAVGPSLAFKAISLAFNIGAPKNGQITGTAEAVHSPDAPLSPPETPEPLGSPPPLQEVGERNTGQS